VRRHLIIGAGTVGISTGDWLVANNERTDFYDKNSELLKELKNKGYNTVTKIEDIYDCYWICTAEWNVDEAVKLLPEYDIVVIRSTVPPGKIDELSIKIKDIAHVPEFLRQETATTDVFNADRVIIGTRSIKAIKFLTEVFEHSTCPIFFTTPLVSETVKLVSNAWLSTQISFWNEIKMLCGALDINPQEVANVVRLDQRISNYGTAMTGRSFGGFCLPKDLDALIDKFIEKNATPKLLNAVKSVNEDVKKMKKENKE